MIKGTELTDQNLFIIHPKDTNNIKQALSINGLLAWFIPLADKCGLCR